MSLAERLVSTGGTNVITFLVAAANSILLTRLLGSEGRGEFAIFAASSALLILLLFLGLDFALGYHVAQDRVRRVAVLPSALIYGLAGGAVSFVAATSTALLSSRSVLLPATKQEAVYALMLAASVAGGLVGGAGRAMLLGSRQFHALNLVDIMLALCTLITYGGLLLAVGRWVPGISSGAVLAVYVGLSLIGTSCLWVVAFNRLGLRWVGEFVAPHVGRQMLSLGLKAYVANVLQFLNYRLDYWLVGLFTGFGALGVYSLASSLGQLLWLLPRSVAMVLLPVFASGERRDMERQAQLGRVVLWTTLAVGVVGGGLAPLAIPLFYGHEFAAASLAVRVLLVGCVPYTLSIVLASGLAARGLQSVNAKASFWGFTATLVLDLLLIPRFGVLGAAAASSLSYLVTTGYVLVRFSAAFGIPVRRLVLPRREDAGAAWTALRRTTLRYRR